MPACLRSNEIVIENSTRFHRGLRRCIITGECRSPHEEVIHETLVNVVENIVHCSFFFFSANPRREAFNEYYYNIIDACVPRTD